MSSTSSNNVVSYSSGSDSSNTTISFNRPGAWNWTKMMGAAFVLPEELRGIALKPVLHVEFLRVGSPLDTVNPQPTESTKPRKNHVVFRVEFISPQGLPGQQVWLGARIAMDLADREFFVLDNDEARSFL